jgi:surfactin synthase thioesterase subunit
MEGQGGTGPVRLFVSGRRAPSRHRPDTVHTLDQDGVIAALRALSGTDDRVFDDPELLGVVMPALRSDYRAVERHRGDPRATVSVPITALVGDDDHTTSIEEAAAWRGSTTGEFDLHVFPGGHFYLGAEQSAVLRLVSDRLAITTPVGDSRPVH